MMKTNGKRWCGGAETLYWTVLIVPAIALFTHLSLGDIIVQTFNPWAIVWILLAGLTFGFCCVAWCKAFPLIGVGHGVPGFSL
jgi:hypothetical protein